MPEFDKWFSDNAEHLRYDYSDLNAESLVIDLGVYQGTFAKIISEKYACHVYGFEPIKSFFDQSIKNLIQFPKVKLFNYGIGNNDRIEQITLDMDGSSIYNKKDKTLIDIQVRAFDSIIKELNISCIDLIKINTEGCEYEILDHILDKGLSAMCKNIQVQFHDFIPDAVQKRNKIRERLAQTHKTTYSYEFVWENHKIKQ